MQETKAEFVCDANDALKAFLSFWSIVAVDFVILLSQALLPKRGGVRKLDKGLVCIVSVQVFPWQDLCLGRFSLAWSHRR